MKERKHMSKLAVFIGILIVVGVYGGSSFYIGARLIQWLKLLLPPYLVITCAVVYILCALSIVLSFAPLPGILRGMTSWLGSYWMGIYVYLLLFFFALDLVIWLGHLVHIIPSPVPQGVRFYAGLAAILLTVCTVGYGIYNATQIRHVSYEVPTKEDRANADMNIVLISDLHLGAIGSEKRLEKLVQAINRLEPDLVCIAGDIFNDNYDAIRDPERAIRLFQQIRSTYGVYASLGNHDSGRTFNSMLEFLRRSNIKLLTDDYDIVGDRVVLIGRVDPSPIGGYGALKRQPITDLIESLDPHLPVVVMDHTPSNLDEYNDRIDLVLSGHTHKGQIFPAGLVTNAIFEVDYGYYRRDESSPHVIVTSGAGTWGMPMRIASNNEIVSIHLR